MKLVHLAGCRNTYNNEQGILCYKSAVPRKENFF